jgi:hypothetical protein
MILYFFELKLIGFCFVACMMFVFGVCEISFQNAVRYNSVRLGNFLDISKTFFYFS